MNNKMKYKLLISLLLICIVVEAQTPSYFFKNKDAASRFAFLYDQTQMNIPIKTLDCSAVRDVSETNNNEEIFVAAPFKFGYEFDVTYTINDGVWVNNGDKRIWQLEINSPNAYSLNFIFSELNLITEAELYIYNPDGSMVYGAVTANQNLSGTEQFLTDLIVGNRVIIKLIEPLNSTSSSVIRISQVIHAYLDVFNNSEIESSTRLLSCHNDITCYPAWECESKAVALLLMGSSSCTGALINNTANDRKGYFLTAFHCIDKQPYGSVLSETEKNATQSWAFRFNYKNEVCNGSVVSTYFTYNGANFRSAWQDTDFCLVELKNDVSTDSRLTFLGWDRTGSTPQKGIGIHHPLSNRMKISFDNDYITTEGNQINWVDNNNIPTSTSPKNTHWYVDFDNGTTESGSSGSPILDSHNRVIGQLHGGNSSCNFPVSAWYGKFNLSWIGGGTNDTRLSYWLDPNNTGKQTLDKTNLYMSLSISGPSQLCGSATYSVNNLPQGATVTWSYDNMPSGTPLPSSIPFVFVSGQGTGTLVVQQGTMPGGLVLGFREDEETRLPKVPYVGGRTLIATVTLNGQTLVLEKDIYIGPYTPVQGLYNSNNQQVASGQVGVSYDLKVINANNYSGTPAGTSQGFEWLITTTAHSNTMIDAGASVSFIAMTPQTITTKVRYVCDCGTTVYNSKSFSFSAKSGGFILSHQNPASGSVEVVVEQEIFSEDDGTRNYVASASREPYQGAYTLQLWSNTAPLQTINRNTPITQISLSGMLPGVYFLVLIIDNQAVATSQLIVN